MDFNSIEEGLVWWVKPSNVDEEASLEELTKALTSLDLVSYLPPYIDLIKEIYFDIAIFFDTYDGSVILSHDWLKLIYDLYPGIDLQITCYPQYSGEEDDEDDVTAEDSNSDPETS